VKETTMAKLKTTSGSVGARLTEAVGEELDRREAVAALARLLADNDQRRAAAEAEVKAAREAVEATEYHRALARMKQAEEALGRHHVNAMYAEGNARARLRTAIPEDVADRLERIRRNLQRKAYSLMQGVDTSDPKLVEATNARTRAITEALCRWDEAVLQVADPWAAALTVKAELASADAQVED
jgi:hypothetical protein